MGWIRRNIEEIERDRALQLFGLALSLANVLTWVFWRFDFPLLQVLAPDSIPICWPFWENCHVARSMSQMIIAWVLLGYLLVSLVAVLAFARKETVKIGYWILVALLFYRGFFLFQDYRLRLNQHYMLYWTMLAFLLVPGKRAAIRYLVILFYFWAGIIKLNPEWISGKALMDRSLLLIPDALIPAGCVYVIVLELIIVFGLLSKREWVFWGTMAQLALFHLASWGIVGFYYPLLMALILSIFLLDRYLLAPPQLEVPESPRLARSRKIAWVVLLGGFFAVQFIPFAYPGDTAMSGEGRYFSLHMFDAPLECQAIAVLPSDNDKIRSIPLRADHIPGRIHCDPIVYWSIARHICRENVHNPEFENIGVHLRTRRRGHEQWHRVLEIPGFCAANPSYTVLGHNEWIQVE